MYRTFNSGHFCNPRTVMVTVMNFYSCLFKHLVSNWPKSINMHPPPLKILKFNNNITRGISPRNTSTDNGQELTIHEENEVMHIQTNFISRSHTVKRGPIILCDAEPQMTVLAKVEKNRASHCKLDGNSKISDPINTVHARIQEFSSGGSMSAWQKKHWRFFVFF